MPSHTRRQPCCLVALLLAMLSKFPASGQRPLDVTRQLWLWPRTEDILQERTFPDPAKIATRLNASIQTLVPRTRVGCARPQLSSEQIGSLLVEPIAVCNISVRVRLQACERLLDALEHRAWVEFGYLGFEWSRTSKEDCAWIADQHLSARVLRRTYKRP